MDRQKMLVWNDPKTNKNRFYEVTQTGEAVTVRFGRVGDEGRVTEQGPIGDRGFARVVAAKLKKGYKEIAVVTSAGGGGKADLHRAAKSTLVANSDDPRLDALVKRLVESNAHEILKASGGKLQLQDGQITTPLGLLTEEAIREAQELLGRMEKDRHARDKYLSAYMTLVPQNVGRGRTWAESFLTTPQELSDQREFLKQLQQSLEFQEKQASATAGESYDDLFKYRITPVDDPEVIARLEERFRKTQSTHHSQRLQAAKLVNVYSFRDAAADEAFEKRAEELGNLMDGWHGTRAMNLLSIASKGLLTPRRANGLYTTGAMFGQGIYSSTVSTKALGYSDSGVWSSSRSDTHYLFDVGVALGWEYRPGVSTPATTDWNRILDGKVTDGKRGHRVFNSINVKAGYRQGGWSTLLNPETIVPSADQMQIRYLLEFKS